MTIGDAGPTIRQTRKCVRYYIRILSRGILSFSIFGTHRIWGILSQVNFSLGDFAMGAFVTGEFVMGDSVVGDFVMGDFVTGDFVILNFWDS